MRLRESSTSDVRRAVPRLPVLALVGLTGTAHLAGCGGQAEGAPSARIDATDGEWSFRAHEASIGAWTDRRPSGSTIRHEMLVLERPSKVAWPLDAGGEDEDRGPAKGGAPAEDLSRFIVTTSSPTLDDRLSAILAGRIPVKQGMRANFALGSSAPVRIERIRPNGARELVAETRVSFLEIER